MKINFKIKKLETFTNTYVSVVKLTMFDDSIGWGQMSTYCADITCEIFHRQIAPHVIGVSFSSFDDLEDLILRKEHKFPGSYILRALAGLDTALWDWLGKIKESPVVTLLGGNIGTIRAYGSSMKRDITPQEEAQRLCHLRDTFGFNAFKFRIGSECGKGKDEWEGRTEEIINVVPKALGNGVEKLVDANSCYLHEDAIEISKKLIDNDICHFEEPCPYWLPEETKKVTDAISIDVTGGEQDCDLRVWQDLIDRKITDIFQPDIMYMGGLTRSLKVAKMAADANMPCTPHAANLSLVTICTMHFLKAIPNAGKYLELSIEGEDYYPWQIDLFDGNPFMVLDGECSVPDSPGWGVQFSKKWLEKSHHRVCEI